MEGPTPVDAVIHLAVYGPLGVLALLGVVATFFLYRDGRRDRKAHAVELSKLNEAHRQEIAQVSEEREAEREAHQREIQTMIERYTTKTENQLEKYQNLASSLKDVVGSALRRYSRDSSDPRDGSSGSKRP